MKPDPARDFVHHLETLLAHAGIDASNAAPGTLAPLDQFHTRGLHATRELASLTALRAGDRVLDVGGGLGGPARTLAVEVGCRVVVCDLSERYARAGRRLTGLAGLAPRVAHATGDAMRLPFADASFDVVWTQHAQMNVADKPGLYAELRRVLASGGRLALHDVCAGAAGPARFPTPWARDAADSHLVAPDALRAAIRAAGFVERVWRDETAASAAFMAERAASRAARPLSMRALLGEWFGEAVANQAWNLAHGRAAVVLGVFETA